MKKIVSRWSEMVALQAIQSNGLRHLKCCMLTVAVVFVKRVVCPVLLHLYRICEAV